MSPIAEPDIQSGNSPELTLQEAFRRSIDRYLAGKKETKEPKDCLIFRQFGFDIAVFIFRDDSPAITHFIEAKAYVGARQNGIGIGNRYGKKRKLTSWNRVRTGER